MGLYSIQKSKRFGLRLPGRRENSRVTQNLKVTKFIKSHYEQRKFCNPYAFFNSQSEDKIKSGSFRPFATLKSSVWRHYITETSPYSFGNFRKLSLYNCFMSI